MLFGFNWLKLRVTPALSGKATNAVSLIDACALVLIPTIGLGLKSRVNPCWCKRCAPYSASSKYKKDAAQSRQEAEFVDACHGHIRLWDLSRTPATISAGLVIPWSPSGQQLEQFW